MKKVLAIILTIVSLSSSVALIANAQNDKSVRPKCFDFCFDKNILEFTIKELFGDMSSLNLCDVHKYEDNFRTCLDLNCHKEKSNDIICGLFTDYLIHMADAYGKPVLNEFGESLHSKDFNGDEKEFFDSVKEIGFDYLKELD